MSGCNGVAQYYALEQIKDFHKIQPPPSRSEHYRWGDKIQKKYEELMKYFF